MSKLVVANWKAHPKTQEEAVMLARGSDVEGLIIAPPRKFFNAVRMVLSRATLATQNFSTVLGEPPAAYTIIGHSDYRAAGETDAQIAEKLKAAFEQRVTPILCVGEQKEIRDQGKAKEFIKNQLQKDFSLVTSSDITNFILVAYEPIWSISATPGATPDTPQNANDMINFIKEQLCDLIKISMPHIKVLYGGSVDNKNAENFLNAAAIDGVLVGGASLNVEKIKKIVEKAKNIK